jgi:hypothetical protein
LKNKLHSLKWWYHAWCKCFTFISKYINHENFDIKVSAMILNIINVDDSNVIKIITATNKELSEVPI